MILERKPGDTPTITTIHPTEKIGLTSLSKWFTTKPMSQEARKPPEFPSLTILVAPRELPGRTWARFLRFHDRVGRQMDQIFARHGVSQAQFDVLMTLLIGGEGITQQELAKRLLVTKGNVCGLIDRMESAGWVERREDPEDRRANRIYLTDNGRQQATQTFPDTKAMVDETLGQLDQRQLQNLYEILGQLDPEA
jgi:DNA-binding MarR family transcriptional regulator